MTDETTTATSGDASNIKPATSIQQPGSAPTPRPQELAAPKLSAPQGMSVPNHPPATVNPLKAAGPATSIDIEMPVSDPLATFALKSAQEIPVPKPPTPGVNPLTTATAKISIDSPMPIAEPPPTSALKPGDDIAKILASIKLPERREAPNLSRQSMPSEPQTLSTELGKKPIAPTAVPNIPAPPPVLNQSAAATPGSEPSATPEAQKVAALASVHTLKDDLQGVVRDQKMSLVRAVSLEEDRRQSKQKVEPPHPPKRSHAKAIFFASVFVLIVLGALAYGIYVIWQVRNTAPQTEEQPFMYIESTYPFLLGNRSGSDIKRTLAQTRTGNEPLGSISRIVPIVSESSAQGQAQREATISEFLEALDSRAPSDLVRAFTGDFLLGVHAAEANVPVLIIPVESFERAFAGMLAWEPNLIEDLAPLFTFVPPQALDAQGFLVGRTFDDAVIRNYDTRVLFRDDGAIGLLYSFPTRNMLVIAEDPASFIEVLSRLRASRQLQ